MAIAFTNLGSSASPDFDSNTDANSYATASWTPPTSGLILLIVNWTKSTNVGNVPTVSGNGLTWVNLGDRQNDIGTFAPGVAIFGANASGATTGATTISFAGETQTSCTALFCQATGVDLTGGVAAAVVQQVEASSASPGTSGSVTGIAALGNAANRLFGGIQSIQIGVDQVTTKDPNWTGLDNFNSLMPAHSVVSQYFPSDGGDTQMDASWASAGSTGGWVGVVIELKAVLSTDYTKTITDSLGITDSVSIARTLARTLTDTVGITDTLSTAVGKVVSIADSLGLTDAITRAVGKVISISDSLGITDLIDAIKSTAQNYVVTINDTLGLTDNLVAYIVHLSRATLKGVRDLVNLLKGKRNKSDSLRGEL